MFKPLLRRYSTRSQMALDISLWKTNTGQKSLSFLAPKIWSKREMYYKTTDQTGHRLPTTDPPTGPLSTHQPLTTDHQTPTTSHQPTTIPMRKTNTRQKSFRAKNMVQKRL